VSVSPAIVGAPQGLTTYDAEGPITRTQATGAQLVKLWSDTQQQFQESRKRILFCRDVAAGKHLVPLPADFQDEASEELVAQLPQRKQLSLRLKTVLAKKRPRLRRQPIGLTDTAQREADELEAWINEACDHLIPWTSIIGKAVEEGEYGLIVCPSGADWRIVPTFLDLLEDGAPGKPKSKYHRDGRGRSKGEHGYEAGSGYHPKKTRDAFEDEYSDFLARRLPVRVRVVSATDCLPLFGDNYETEGLLVRTLYSKQALLRRKFLWSQLDEFAMRQEAVHNTLGLAGQFWLYEAWLRDEDGTPFVAYSVGGMQTSYGEDGKAAVIDLRKEWGLSELPAKYFYGMHTEDDNPDYRGLPFLDPLAPALLNAEALLTSINVHTRKSAFNGWFEKMDPDATEDITLEGDKLKTVVMPSSGGIVQIRGDITPASPAPIGREPFQLVGTLLGAVDQGAPSESVYGGPGAESGRQMVLSREYLEVANSMITGTESNEGEGALGAYQFAAMRVLEVLCGIMRKFKTEIPLYVNTKVPPTGKQGETRAQRQIRDLKEKWIGVIYDVTAHFPEEGANLAEIEQKANLSDRGYATWREVRELQGDESPATTRAETLFDQFLKTPEGLAHIVALAQTIRGVEEEDELEQAKAAGEVTEDGVPVAALEQPMAPPEGSTALPDFAASALGGEIAGDMMTGPMMGEARTLAGRPGGV
jgi:hypothetical protein